jgi:hypothetical protein
MIDARLARTIVVAPASASALAAWFRNGYSLPFT